MANAGKQTGIPLAFLIALAAAPAPAFADFFGGSDRDILETGGTISEVAPDWRIVCLGEGQDKYGVASRHRHCRIEKGGFRAIAVMTSEGLSIPYLPSRPGCQGYSGKMRVDGRSIGRLPLKAKIAAMSRGITFARPYQSWPGCKRVTEFTGLYGFSAALLRLKAEWRKFR
jgi:hypothetical protein